MTFIGNSFSGPIISPLLLTSNCVKNVTLSKILWNSDSFSFEWDLDHSRQLSTKLLSCFSQRINDNYFYISTVILDWIWQFLCAFNWNKVTPIAEKDSCKSNMHAKMTILNNYLCNQQANTVIIDQGQKFMFVSNCTNFFFHWTEKPRWNFQL